MANFHPMSHVAITVTDLERSRAWYERLLGTRPVIDEDTGPYYHVVWKLPDGVFFAIHWHPSTKKSSRFSEFTPGLDHVSFSCSSIEELGQWKIRLDDMGIQHGEIQTGAHGSDLSFRDPDNIALEFFASA